MGPLALLRQPEGRSCAQALGWGGRDLRLASGSRHSGSLLASEVGGVPAASGGLGVAWDSSPPLLETVRDLPPSPQAQPYRVGASTAPPPCPPPAQRGAEP